MRLSRRSRGARAVAAVALLLVCAAALRPAAAAGAYFGGLANATGIPEVTSQLYMFATDPDHLMHDHGTAGRS